jgi:hypothetical protein
MKPFPIADCQLPIFEYGLGFSTSAIGNRKSAMENGLIIPSASTPVKSGPLCRGSRGTLGSSREALVYRSRESSADRFAASLY